MLWLATLQVLSDVVYAEFPTLQNFYEGDMYKYWTCEKMKMSGGLFGGRSTIKVTSKLLKIQKSRTCGCNLTFDLWKLSGRERQKGKIKRSNTLFADQKAWSRSQTLQQATYKWLPLGVADWISGNDRRLAQPSQMWVTAWLFYAGERVSHAKSGCHPQNAGELEGLSYTCDYWVP